MTDLPSNPCILAIESSCDETSAAVYLPARQQLFQEIYSQVALHADYGGVVPELASRSHLEKLYGVVESVLSQSSLTLGDVDAVAYTRGPGLVGPLLIGASYADALSLALDVPLLPVHHLEAHITIPMFAFSDLCFPFLALLVSGGHTELILAKDLGHYELLGSTMDDAAGEAFDKCGKVMGLDYPAGPKLAQLADAFVPGEYPDLPTPLKGNPTLDFSFSGLKTAFARSWDLHHASYSSNAFAYAIQHAIVHHLTSRVKKVWSSYPEMPLVVAGGVAANQCLRTSLSDTAQSMQRQVYFPDLCYCTDNAGMIAHNAYLHWDRFGVWGSRAQRVRPRWPIETLLSRDE